ncbi:DUF7475 family protein [Halalkalicoccus subterraneus]|uniref:DUF7475 family protein n=1 Tax=Halalkalicoccus subterraneus TaxID=2675002 RepID=UPI000EFA7FDA|nr:hypothetical protein [Halalkalicoccus subterraneus]
MSHTTSNVATDPPLITGIPTGIVPYVMITAALISAAIHLWLAPVVIEFDTMQAVLFVLASFGFIGGIVVYASRYWRREFYLLASLFALAQLIAYFVMGGPVNAMAIVSKAAEAIVVLAAGYLYVTAESVRSPSDSLVE